MPNDPQATGLGWDEEEKAAMRKILQDQFDSAMVRSTLPTWPERHELEREWRIRRAYR